MSEDQSRLRKQALTVRAGWGNGEDLYCELCQAWPDVLLILPVLE